MATARSDRSPEGLRYAAIRAALRFAAIVAALVVQALRPAVAQSPTYGLGHTPSADELKRVDIEILPDGRGLPTGSGTAAIGKQVYTAKCLTCHGPTGR